jgi:hypothetical protein
VFRHVGWFLLVMAFVFGGFSLCFAVLLPLVRACSPPRHQRPAAALTERADT